MAKRGKVITKVLLEEKDERPVRSRKYEEYFLIVCEDEKSEPYYFGRYQDAFDKLLPNRTVFLLAVGAGRNSLGVVQQAILERSRLQDEAGKHVDHVWAVFDKDSLDESEGNRDRFEKAFVLAKEEGVNIAYSNECFELWLMLHFKDVAPDSPLSRNEDIYPVIDDLVNNGRTEETRIPYDHKHPSPAFIDAVNKSGSQKKAILRAIALDNYHISHHHAPIDSNPNTLVYKLVNILNDLYDWYHN